MIRNLIFLLIASALISGCATLFQKPDPAVGQWDYNVQDLPRGNPNGIMTISKEGDVYTGTLAADDNQWELTDLVIEGNELVGGTFVAQRYNVDISGTFDGDTFTGQINVEGRVFTMTAERMN